jgi:hypothetical protein
MPVPSHKQLPAPSGMEIGWIHSFLIYPGKNAENPHDINGTAVPMSGVLFEIYGVSEIKRNGQYSGTFAGVLILLQASR